MNNPNGGEGERRSVEVQARTVDEAVARGLVRLGGLSRSEVKIEVLQEPKGGLLGFGGAEATVRLTTLLPGETAEATWAPKPGDTEPTVPDKPAPQASMREVEPSPPARRAAPAPPEPRRAAAVEDDEDEAADVAIAPDEAEQEAVAVISKILEGLGHGDATVKRATDWLPEELSDDKSLVISVAGANTKRLLYKDAEALQALQFVVRLMLARQLNGWVNLLIDVDGDRARRIQELVSLANQSADLVEKEGRPVALPPMSPYERRVVHLLLSEHPLVTTQSIGRGETRKVTVRRKDQVLPELG